MLVTTPYNLKRWSYTSSLVTPPYTLERWSYTFLSSSYVIFSHSSPFSLSYIPGLSLHLTWKILFWKFLEYILKCKLGHSLKISAIGHMLICYPSTLPKFLWLPIYPPPIFRTKCLHPHQPKKSFCNLHIYRYLDLNIIS